MTGAESSCTPAQRHFLAQLARALLGQATLDGVVREIARALVEEQGFDDCVVYLHDPGRGMLLQRAVHTAAAGAREVAYQRIEIPLGAGIVGAAAQAQRTEVVHDVRQDSRYLVNHVPHRSEIAVPVIHAGQLVGMIDSEHPEVGFFDAERVVLMEALADMVAVPFATGIKAEANLADIRRAHEEAREAVRAQEEFLANVSHEVRTPLVAVLGVARLLRQRVEEGAELTVQLDLIDILQRSGSHLLAIVQQLLDFSGIEQAGPEVYEEIGPQELLAGVSAMFRPKAASAGLQLITEVGTGTPEKICTELTRLRQILVNLVDNAIKFTPAGGEVRVIAEAFDGQRIRFRVDDNGVGIAAAEQKRIFQSFVTAGFSGVDGHGTGLGLAIAWKLARQLDGELTVVSTLTKGSSFRLLLPQRSGRGVHTAGADEPLTAGPSGGIAETVAGFRVLLAEDDLDSRRLVTFQLEEDGHQVTAVADGSQALDLALAEIKAGSPFDAILLDMSMPGLDGFAVARRLRAVGFDGPVFALTAHALPMDRARCLEAGCSDYFAKPFNWNQLLERLRASVAASPQ